MLKQSQAQQSSPRTIGKRPATDAPEVSRHQQQDRFYLSKYRDFRLKLDLNKRFAELLWSYPFRTDHLPHLRPTWSATLEHQHGDKHWNDRRALQQEALRNIAAQVRAPLRRARIRADQRGADRMETLDARRTMLAATARDLTAQVCAIGEQFRDEWWLICRDGFHIDRAREEEEEITWQLGPSWRDALKRRLKFVDQHYGPLVECEYRDALRRVAALEPAFRKHCESFWRMLLPQAVHYSRPRAGKPHPPAKAAKKALCQLGIAPNDRTRFLKAWCLQPLSPAETRE